jgi:hypothetical protein
MAISLLIISIIYFLLAICCLCKKNDILAYIFLILGAIFNSHLRSVNLDKKIEKLESRIHQLENAITKQQNGEKND